VSHTDGLLVFRPFIWEGSFSSGVKAEIRHWELLARTEDTKRAVFIHFEEDIGVWLDNNETRIENELNNWMERVLEDKFEITVGKAREVREWITRTKGGILDGGPLPTKDMQRISEQFPDIKKEAKINLLESTLTCAVEVADSQVGLWVCGNMEELQANFDEIADFLKTGKLPGESWHSKIDMMLSDGT